MNKLNILLAEDDQNLGTVLKEYLEAKDYKVDLAVNGEEAYTFFKKNTFDLCLLDVMMPIKDGFTLAKEIRNINQQIPIIFLTAKSMKDDTIKGYLSGADDYITKPFSMEVLLLKLSAILRRTDSHSHSATAVEKFTIGTYHFDHSIQELEHAGNIKKLTFKESELLQLLCMHLNEILDRNYALNSIWKDDDYFKGRSMDVYITRLRKYLKEDPRIEILNMHGKGFKLIVHGA
jgi:two-component system OmpR family response regulator